MAHVLNIVDGSGTVTLNSSSKRVIRYVPQAPQLSPEQMRQILAGSKLADALTVSESAEVEISGANAAAVQTAIQALEKSLTVSAYRRDVTDQGNRVFVQYTPDGTSGLYRSEIVAGRVELAADAQDYGRWLTNFKVNVVLGWTRKFYWEANSETNLPLTNESGTATTGGGTVYNHNDADANDDNFVTIDSGDAAGVIPCPFKIEMVNTYGTAARRVYIAHKAQGTPASFTHILEAEAATLGGLATAGGVANTSGGTAVTVTNVPTGGTAIFSWAITATQAGYIPSQWVRPIARFSTAPNNSTIKVRFLLKDTTTLAVMYQTDWQTLTTDPLQVLPAVYFSPVLQGQTTPGGMTLVMEGKDSAGTGDFVMDFLQLSPCEAGTGFVQIKPVDESLVTIPATSGTITLNQIDDAIYIESRQNVYQVFGGPLMCYPGAAQRLYFLFDGTADAAVARTMTVKAYIRPRRLTV